LETFIQGHIDGLLVTASWVERLRGELGLLGVHQVWGEVPAWYFWLAGSPGAYCLEMAEVAQGAGGLISAMFAIKFYPALDSEFFLALPPQERQARRGRLFDASGAPAFESRREIPAEMFTVGAMALDLDPEDDWGLYTITALDTCRQVRLAGGNGNGQEVLQGSVPGWRLSYALYHKLLSLHAFHKKQSPVHAQFSFEPGFEKVEAPGGGMEVRRSSGNKTFTLAMLFAMDPATPPAQALELMRRDLDDAGGRELVSQNFACQHFSGWEIAIAGQPVLSEDWWRLAGVDYKSELASSCGCQH
jgi:hypothetical protein